MKLKKLLLTIALLLPPQISFAECRDVKIQCVVAIETWKEVAKLERQRVKDLELEVETLTASISAIPPPKIIKEEGGIPPAVVVATSALGIILGLIVGSQL